LIPWDQDRELLAMLCIVSEIAFVADFGVPAETVTAFRSPYPKCERCWNHRPSVGQDPAHPTLCERCARVVANMGSFVAST
jgi:isoleucyl-tRNA synthetase